MRYKERDGCMRKRLKNTHLRRKKVGKELLYPNRPRFIISRYTVSHNLDLGFLRQIGTFRYLQGLD